MNKIDVEMLKKFVYEAVAKILAKENMLIPIGVSNRHIHISQEDFEECFGKGKTLTKIKELSQIGEFACQETVTLIGPKGNIKKVRILGPFRDETQVEISRTDSFNLGLKIPLRDSGNLKNTPGIILEGEFAKKEIKQGVILAKRHLHLDLESADKFNLKNGDMVDVELNTENPIVLRQVTARVSDKYCLELHIDTDEANGAGVETGNYASIFVTETKKEAVNEQNQEQTCTELSKKVITAEDIRMLQKQGQKKLKITKKSRLTPLAKDEAKMRGVEIECI